MDPQEIAIVMSGKVGRPPYDPTPKDRGVVKTMAAFGIPQDDIARVLSIHPQTLRKHFAHEIDVAATEANAKVAQSLFQKATGEGRESVIAAIFWLKARAGWRDRDPAVEFGKKQHREMLAQTAEKGTNWEALLQ